MAVKKSDVVARFEGDCPNCEGSGLWMQRHGCPCRRCSASGRVPVVLVKTTVTHAGVQQMSFRVVNPSGSISKVVYEVPATLIERQVTDHIVHTIGSGLSGTKIGEFVRECGHKVGVRGIVQGDDGDAAYHVSYRDGGYTALPASAIRFDAEVPAEAVIA